MLNRFLYLPLFLLLALPARAQDASSSSPEISLAIGGTVQARGSYIGKAITSDRSLLGREEQTIEDEGLGFALRRVRLRMDVSVGERFLGYVNLDAASGTVELLDAYAGYRLTDALIVRIGRMGSAQPGGKVTSHTRIDGFERPFIVRRWESGTRDGDARALGVDLLYETDQVEAMLFFHSGGTENFRPEIERDLFADVNLISDLGTGMAVSGYASHDIPTVEGLEVGAYAEYNSGKPQGTSLVCVPDVFCDAPRTYTSYAGHIYWGERPGSQPIRAKLDVIGVDYSEFSRGGRDVDQQTIGASLLAAVKVIDATELYARLEHYDDGLDDLFIFTDETGQVLDIDREPYRILSVGLNFSPSALVGRPYRQARLTFGYSTALNRPTETETFDFDEHLFVLQAQLVF